MGTAERANATAKIARGLEGVYAAATHIAEVDGANGRLTLRGYDIRELIGRVTFEEVAYLLWHGELPNHEEYSALRDEMTRARDLPPATIAALRELAPHTSGMHMLRMAAAMLSLDDSGRGRTGHQCQSAARRTVAGADPDAHRPHLAPEEWPWSRLPPSLSTDWPRASCICSKGKSHRKPALTPSTPTWV